MTTPTKLFESTGGLPARPAHNSAAGPQTIVHVDPSGERRLIAAQIVDGEPVAVHVTLPPVNRLPKFDYKIGQS